MGQDMLKTYDNYKLFSENIGLRRLGAKEGSVRIIFFPYVGGQSLSFKPLAEALPKAWELWALDPPGHGWAGGDLLTDFNQMVRLYFSQLPEVFQGNFYFYGHSLGGMVAYKLTQLLENENIRPGGIFIGASPIPHRLSEYEYLLGKDKHQLMDFFSRFGEIPKAFVENSRLLLHYVSHIEADIKVFLSSDIRRSPVISTPMTVLYSREDTFFNYENIYEWDIYGHNVFFKEVKGNHIFIQSHSHLVASAIEEFILQGEAL